jgi:hypothetical protein
MRSIVNVNVNASTRQCQCQRFIQVNTFCTGSTGVPSYTFLDPAFPTFQKYKFVNECRAIQGRSISVRITSPPIRGPELDARQWF